MPKRRGQLTPKQVARAIGVSESSVKRWCDSGEIEFTTTPGGHRRLPIPAVLAFLERSGHQLADPTVLGLPSTTGQSARMLERGRSEFAISLSAENEPAAQQTIADLLQTGQETVDILDHVLFPALDSLTADRAKSGRPANPRLSAGRPEVVICHRILSRLREDWLASAETDSAEQTAVAITAAIDGATEPLIPLAAQIVLQSAGWHTTCLGTLLPFKTLLEAARELHAKLLFIYIPVVRDASELSRHVASLLDQLDRTQTKLILYGSALESQQRDHWPAAIYCASFASLKQVGEDLRSARRS